VKEEKKRKEGVPEQILMLEIFSCHLRPEILGGGRGEGGVGGEDGGEGSPKKI
jgi:hypothetical protein